MGIVIMCEQRDKILILINEYQSNKINLVELLQGMQEFFGYLPQEEVERVCKICNIPLTRAYEIMTFYAQFKLMPPAKYMINVCTGTACYIKGADELIGIIRRECNIPDGENVSSDVRFALGNVRCLGCCSLAPVVTINGEIYGRMSPKKLRELLKTLE